VAIELYPAVDVLDGKAVRLEQGDYGRATVYQSEPLEAARNWVEAGARRLHVVDLDGAKRGAPAAIDHLRSIAGSLGVPVQYGGGLRTVADARAAIEAGAARIVLGTVAFKDLEVLDALVAELGDRLAVSVDVREGKVATDGWIERTELDGVQAILALRERGVRAFVYTNVDLDGTLAGLRTAELGGVARAVGDGELVWSGGIGSLEDLRELARSAPSNVAAVIVGKALYERRFTIGEAVEALS
jgi:phosphoribosylformimino-5-aminoimidazole carboxamide ribotide isomerase